MCNRTPHKVYELARGESYEPKSVNNNQTNKNKLIYALSGVLLKRGYYTKLDFLYHVYMHFY